MKLKQIIGEQDAEIEALARDFAQTMRDTPAGKIAQLRQAAADRRKAAEYADFSWQDKDEADRLEAEARAIEKQEMRDRGDIKTVTIDVPEELSRQLHMTLHDAWKVKPGFAIPWEWMQGNAPGSVKLVFRDIADRDHRHGGVTVQDLIDIAQKAVQ